MQGSFILNASHTIEVMKMVRSSLETIRNIVAGGQQTEESKSQIQRLQQLEEFLLDQEARLDAINKVLEEFNYSVAHELFAPLRRISGFTREIKLRYAHDMELDGIGCLNGILQSSQQMNELIDALMLVSKLAHIDLELGSVNLTELAKAIAEELGQSSPERKVALSIEPDMVVTGDAYLLRIALQKLLENAWKFTLHRENPSIEFGRFQRDGENGFFVRDNGVGFDMAGYDRLFHPFQRLHEEAIFPGNGIGLTTVKRAIDRHGGRVWGEGAPDQGATFYFTL